MTIATIKKVNAAIASTGIELVKAFDYFYFMPLADHDSRDMPESVYVRSIRDLSLERWIEAAKIEN